MRWVSGCETCWYIFRICIFLSNYANSKIIFNFKLILCFYNMNIFKRNFCLFNKTCQKTWLRMWKTNMKTIIINKKIWYNWQLTKSQILLQFWELQYLQNEGIRAIPGVMKIFCILIVMWVTWVRSIKNSSNYSL